jgi:hypothetical protein
MYDTGPGDVDFSDEEEDRTNQNASIPEEESNSIKECS